ncbi:hypothetical protein WOSG25_080240 [Weissella oryzae SG25]|uniref:Uncharacterized protein n=2 Tax=Weissella TaxID=46255 RepID=A0A069CUW9_WEIOS|nr:hypothetical protein WOSG25_080240 [Weissella oryzae SG25]
MVTHGNPFTFVDGLGNIGLGIISFIIFFIIEMVLSLIFLRAKAIKLRDSKHTYQWLTYLGVIILLWLPYIVLAFPGVIGWDGADQLNGIFRSNMPAQNIHFYGTVFNYAHQQFYLTNHHPLLTSLFLGGLYWLGYVGLKSAYFGVAIITLVQALLLGTALAYLVSTISTLGKRSGWFVISFFGLFPIFPILVVNVNKTAIFLITLVFFFGALIRLMLKQSKFSDQLILLVSGVCLVLVRNDSFLLLFTAIFVFLIFRLPLKQLLATFATALFVFAIWSKVLLPALHVEPTESVEALALPSQQIVYTLKHKPEAFSAQSKHKLAKLADLKLMTMSYTNGAYDPIKHTYYYYPDGFFVAGKSYTQRMAMIKAAPINAHKAWFWSIWLEGLKNAPSMYINAFIRNYYHYQYFGDRRINFDLGFAGAGFVPYEDSKLFADFNNLPTEGQKRLATFMLNLQNFVPTNILLTTGFWGLTTVLLTFISFALKNKFALAFSIMALSTIAVGFLSPVDGYLRYVLPVMLTIPMTIMLLSGTNTLKVNDGGN